MPSQPDISCEQQERAVARYLQKPMLPCLFRCGSEHFIALSLSKNWSFGAGRAEQAHSPKAGPPARGLRGAVAQFYIRSPDSHRAQDSNTRGMGPIQEAQDQPASPVHT